MPSYARRKSRRRPRRRALRSRRKRSRRVRRDTTVVRGVNPFSPRLICKLKYADRNTFTTTGNVIATYLWNMNSIFDPDRTGTGHQPYGYDTLATIYQKYRVFAFRYRITLITEAAGEPITWIVTPQNHASAASAVSLAMEEPRSISKISQLGIRTMFKGKVSLPRIAGQTSSQYRAGDYYSAVINADPAEIMCLRLTSFSAAAVTFIYTITLEYYVEFFDPLQLGQS